MYKLIMIVNLPFIYFLLSYIIFSSCLVKNGGEGFRGHHSMSLDRPKVWNVVVPGGVD